MGHHFTTPAPSCKEQNGQGEEMTVSLNNFINDSQAMSSQKQRSSPGQDGFTGLECILRNHPAKLGLDPLGIMG